MLIMGMSASAQDWSAIKTSKAASRNDDGSVALVLHSYVTGSGDSRVTTVTKSVPLDIALVLDVSGSMAESISGVYDATSYNTGTSPGKLPGAFDIWLFGWCSGYYVHANDGNYYPATMWEILGSWRKSYTIGDKSYDFNSLQDKTLYKSVSRLAALQRAANTFIDNIAEKSSSDAQHQISIIKFAGDNSTKVGDDTYGNNNYNNSQVVKSLTGVSTSNNVTSLKEAISKLKASGATRADLGMAHAKAILSASPAKRNGQDVSKVVVMFTDGAPTSSNSFENAVANSAISSANDMKLSGVKVYTVGTFGEKMADNVNTYMDRVSSNYTGATNMTNNQAKKVDTKYYMLATSNDGLNSIFSTISNDITSDIGKSDVELKTEDVVIKDIVTEHFVLPEGASSVKLQVVPAIATDATFSGSGSYGWGEAMDAPDDIEAKLVSYTGNQTSVEVRGFDFASNWAGLKKYYKNNVEDPSRREVHGAKIVITIHVIPDPDGIGGKVFTNDDASGIYVSGVSVSSNPGGAVANYRTPDPFYIPMDLIIRKNGLNPGESAIFEVTRSVAGVKDDGFKYTVVMTAGADGTTEDKVIMKVDAVDSNDALYTYTVKETAWSWAYTTTTPVIEHSLYDGETPNILFEFTNSSKSGLPKHAENSKNNVFMKQ